ncbi:hypothetical protein GQ53DRAFT_376167 [Thozetella sp. PMI_491]|nr:hypothetical protein GQ53DRAFT_376167 [Thozetella sp. PMI_491]
MRGYLCPGAKRAARNPDHRDGMQRMRTSCFPGLPFTRHFSCTHTHFFCPQPHPRRATDRIATSTPTTHLRPHPHTYTHLHTPTPGARATNCLNQGRAHQVATAPRPRCVAYIGTVWRHVYYICVHTLGGGTRCLVFVHPPWVTM